MNSLASNLFPKRLARLPYLFRIVIIDLLWLLLAQWKRSLTLPLTGVQFWEFISGCIVVFIYTTFFIIVPRLRDSGMTVWWVLPSLVPIVWLLMHLILAIQPSKTTVAARAT